STATLELALARHRIIKPGFPHWPGIRRVGRDARLLFIYLWTVVDDAGRWKIDREHLLGHYYDGDCDAPMCLALCLGDLEREECLEIYRVDDVEYLRVINWRRLHRINHPTPSKLPGAPSEPAGSLEALEESDESQGNRACSRDPLENEIFSAGTEV